METLSYWKRPERWLAFFLTFLGVCSFLAIIQVRPNASVFDEPEVADVIFEKGSFIDNLRAGAIADRLHGHWTSLLPPLLAVIVASYFRSLVAALMVAFFTGAVLSYGTNPITTTFLAFHDFIYLNTVSPPRLYLFLFLFTLIGMVYVISRNGGLKGLVDLFGRFAKGRKGTQSLIASAGVLAFFDDYVSTILVGSAMRRLSDYWRLSREKLAFLVDSTAVPLSAIALISTWTALNATLTGEEISNVGIEMGGYEAMLHVLPMRFYCIGLLFFVFASTITGRDFGAMLVAEDRALSTGKVKDDNHQMIGFESSSGMDPDEGISSNWINAAIPLIVVLLFTLFGIFIVGLFELRATGEGASVFSLEDWKSTFSAASSGVDSAIDSKVLPVFFLASVVGGVVAIGMTIKQRILSPSETCKSYIKGMPTMWMAIFILVMTWAMQAICETLGTGEYLIALLGDNTSIWTLPLFVFIISAGMSFAIGSGKGAIAILMPIVVPLIFDLSLYNGGSEVILFLTIAAVLDGAVFGDHCSPISDTTVLASIASGCDHIAHVNTQILYAIFTMGMAAVLGYLSVARDLPIWFFYTTFPALTLLILFVIGRKPKE
ncbi:hypothetical protein MLD52_05610 [Puniceicoccaceae bacterium K14]|nr:hypothetical protein [Puniceicoccaceae bacterium K14]